MIIYPGCVPKSGLAPAPGITLLVLLEPPALSLLAFTETDHNCKKILKNCSWKTYKISGMMMYLKNFAFPLTALPC